MEEASNCMGEDVPNGSYNETAVFVWTSTEKSGSTLRLRRCFPSIEFFGRWWKK
jgi:hypothetical protein